MQTVFASAAGVLGVEFVIAWAVDLPSGEIVIADVFFPQYGSEKGTLVFALTGELLPVYDELIAEGYAVSLVDVSNQTAAYSVEELAVMLSDWGWCGASANRPSWLSASDP